MKNGAASQFLPREIEDGVSAELRFSASIFCPAPCHRHRGDKVLRRHVKLQVTVMRVWQLGIEDGLSSARPQIQRCDGSLCSLGRSCGTDHVRSFNAIVVEAQVGKLRRGVRKDFAVKRQAHLPRGLRRSLNRPLIAEVTNLRRRGYESE